MSSHESVIPSVVLRPLRRLLLVAAGVVLQACSGQVANDVRGDGGGRPIVPEAAADHQVEPAGEEAGDTNRHEPDGDHAADTSPPPSSPDASSCSACAGTCVDDRCIETLATLEYTPISIALDETYLYWADEGDLSLPSDGYIARMPKSGLVAGGQATTIASGHDQPAGLVLSGTQAYWVDQATDRTSFTQSVPGGAVVTAPASGGASSVTLAAQQNYPGAVAVDGTNVYWTSYYDGTVMACGLTAGSTVTTLAAGQTGAGAIVVRDATLYWTVDGSTNGAIVRLSSAGGAPVTLASQQQSPGGLVVDATSVYWTNFGSRDAMGNLLSADGSIVKLGLAAGALPITLASGQEGAGAIAVDSVSVYWANSAPITNDGTLARVPLTGGSATVLATHQGPLALAVDSASVYWADLVVSHGALISTLKKTNK